jgi:enoyl-CoA hydratase/carnithine racemase
MPTDPRDATSASADYTAIDYTVDGSTAIVTLNRPDRLNAFTPRMAAELVDAADRWDADDNVRCVIITGAGRGFCAGAELSGGEATFDAVGSSDYIATSSEGSALPRIEDRHGEDEDAVRDIGGWVTLRFYRSLKPLIAAVNGAAVGIGATMTLPMDIRLCSEGARYGFVFGARGIVPEACSSWFLPRIVGISTALEWCYRTELISAEEARAGGLARSIHPADSLLDAAKELADTIAAKSAPLSTALARHMMWSGLGMSHPMEAHHLESRAVASTGRSADAREGIRSFFQKRPAEWTVAVSDNLPEWFPWVEEPPFR